MKGKFGKSTTKYRTGSQDGNEKANTRDGRARSESGPKPSYGARSESGPKQGYGARSESGPRPGYGARPESGPRQGYGARLESGSKQGNWRRQERPSGQARFKKPESVEVNEAIEQNESHEDYDKVEGRNPVIEALKSGRSINKIFISKGDKEGSINQIIAMAKEKGVVIQEVDRSRLDIMSTSQSHQGVIAFTAAKDYVEVDDILEIAAASGTAPFIIILDEITDVYNLGSILRSANATGAHGVIIPKRRAIGLTAAVGKASAGAIEYVPVARVTNISQTIDYLKKKNIWVVGTDSTGEKPYFENNLTGPIALVIGSEGEGIGKLVRESCDFIVNIPMKGQISSLNAAVAGAIVMYEILKQRSK